MRSIGHKALLASLLAVALCADGIPAPAAPSIADEVQRMRSEVEALLKAAEDDRRRAPELEKEAKLEKERAVALARELEAAKAELERVREEAAKTESDARAAEDEAAAEERKGETLAGFQKLAWELLGRNPQATAVDLVPLALRDPQAVRQVLERATAQAAAKAAEALAALSRQVGEPIPAEQAAGIGRAVRPAPEAERPDGAAQLDALALAIEDAMVCAGVPTTTAAKIEPFAAVPHERAILAAAHALASRLRSAMSARRLSAANQVEAALPTIRPALGSDLVSRAAARSAVAHAIRNIGWDAARAALSAFVRHRTSPARPAPFPRAAQGLLRALERETGIECRPGDAR